VEDILIRQAVIEDAALILEFVRELAKYEKAENEVTATVSDIEASIFGPSATVESILCYRGGNPVGLAVYFYNYSTWLGRNGLYLEDLYVSPQHRGVGVGKALLKYLARKAISKNCGRFEWSVLDWNEPAIKFYESIGARPKSEWVGYQLAGEFLVNFAEE